MSLAVSVVKTLAQTDFSKLKIWRSIQCGNCFSSFFMVIGRSVVYQNAGPNPCDQTCICFSLQEPRGWSQTDRPGSPGLTTLLFNKPFFTPPLGNHCHHTKWCSNTHVASCRSIIQRQRRWVIYDVENAWLQDPVGIHHLSFADNIIFL